MKALAATRGRVCAMGLIGAAAASGWLVLAAGCRLTPSSPKMQTPQGCAECHADIAREWEGSAHARAWTNPTFVSQTRNYIGKPCLACHAPAPLLEQPASEDPKLRPGLRAAGVDCVACHKVGTAYAGGHRCRAGPHETVQDLTRLPCADFCGACHVREYEQYVGQYVPAVAKSGTVKTCAGCHMPISEKRLTQGHLLSLIHPKRAVHDHSFPIWREEITRGCIVAGDPRFGPREPERLTVEFFLTNRGAGHSVPTGKFGYCEVRVLLEALDANGRVVGQSEQSRTADAEDALLFGEETLFFFEIDLEPKADPVSLRLAVERVNADRSFRWPLGGAHWPVAATVPEASGIPGP